MQDGSTAPGNVQLQLLLRKKGQKATIHMLFLLKDMDRFSPWIIFLNTQMISKCLLGFSWSTFRI